jgi:O-antigen ligase
MLESSYICIFFSKLSHFFSKQFEKSSIIQAFLSQKDKEEISQGSIAGKIFNILTSLFKKLFCLLKLNQLLKGSIFVMPYLWALPVIALAPFVPTMAVLGLVVISLLSLLAWLSYNKENKLNFFTLNKYVLLYIAVYLYSAFASVSVISSIKVAALTVGLMFFYFTVVNVIDTKKKFDIAMLVFLAGGVLVSLYGIYQYLFPGKFSGVWVDTEMFESINFRVYSTFANPNVLGEYLLLTIPFTGAYFVTEKKVITKLIALGSMGIMMLCLLLTYSRGCYLGVLIAAAIFLVLLDKRFILVGIVGLLMLPMIMPDTIIHRFMSIGNMQDSSTSYRVNIWLGTISMLRDYWLSGVGPGIEAYNKVYPMYGYNGIAAPHSHNLYLQIMCDTGIAGIIVFLSILYKFYRTTFSQLVVERVKENRVFIIASVAAITAFAMQSLTDYTFYNYRVLLIFWMVLAFGTVTTKLSRFEQN